jgi:hypothetical protein
MKEGVFDQARTPLDQLLMRAKKQRKGENSTGHVL